MEEQAEGGGGDIAEGENNRIVGREDEEPMAIGGNDNQEADLLEGVVMGHEDPAMDTGGTSDQTNVVDNIQSDEETDGQTEMENTVGGLCHDLKLYWNNYIVWIC